MLDQLISLIAPYDCITCHKEGQAFCDECYASLKPIIPGYCFGCGKASLGYQVCTDCQTNLGGIKQLWAISEYAGIIKLVLKDYKFNHKRGLAKELAGRLDDFLPHLDPLTIIVHVPTSTNRVRQRGFDHAALLARNLSKKRRLMHVTALRRVSQNRQLGATRAERFSNTKDAFIGQHLSIVQGARILLVDDVVTTGATLSEAAAILYKAGAKHIDAAVIAQTMI